MCTMQTTPNKPEARPAPRKASNAKPPDVASASVPDTLAALKVNPETGLTRAEVDTRRKENGYNEVAEQKGHPLFKFLRKFWGISAWERFILARRISDYDPANLDQLGLTGAVGWGRLSPHPATLETSGTDENGNENRRRVIPTRVAPIAFFVREDADWMRPHHPGAEDSSTSFLSPVAQALLELLKQRGALFFPDMVRATGRLKAEVETGLWELVAAGLVTADGFENLRALVTPKSASGSGAGKAIGKIRRPRHAPGRWSLLD